MTTWLALTVFAVLPVSDIDVSESFYAALFGRAADGRPSPGIVEWYLVDPGMPERGTLQLRLDVSRAGGGLATINVSDVTNVRAAAEGLGLTLPTQTFAIAAEAVDSVTVGEIVDPDGNGLTVVQPHLRA